MSSKIGITPDEITAAIKAMPEAASLPQASLESAMAIMEARPAPAIHTRVILYRYDQGPTARADTVQAQLQSGTLPLHALCAEMNCDLRLIELGSGDATPDENARACAFGMMAAEQDTGMLVIAGFGAGSDARNSDPHDFFATATPETAAVLGAIVAGARAGIPVFVEGAIGLAAARALEHLRPDLRQYAFAGESSEDIPGYTAMLMAAAMNSEFIRKRDAA